MAWPSPAQPEPPAAERLSFGEAARSLARRLRAHSAAVIGISAYLLGVVARWGYGLRIHPPRHAVISDAIAITSLAERLLDAESVQRKGDSIWPPGEAAFLAWMTALDPTLLAATVVQVVAACLIPLLIAHSTWLLLGRSRAAWIALAMASLHFGFIHYTGFFLAEQMFQLAATLALWVSIIVCTRLDRGSAGLSRARLLLLGAAFGAPWALGSYFRPNAIPIALAVMIALGAYWLWRRERRKCWSLVGAAVMLAALIAPAAHRCSQLKEQGFCPVSANFAMNVALGQAGEVNRVDFIDPQTHRDSSVWTPPSLIYHGGEGAITVPHTIWDTSGVLGWVYDRVAASPGKALLRAAGNGLDLFSVPYWPEAREELNPRIPEIASRLFFAAVIIPGLVGFWRSLGSIRRRRAPSAVLLVAAGLVAVFLLGCLSHGEARYRLPFDLGWIACAAGIVAGPAKTAVSRRSPGRALGAAPYLAAAGAAAAVALLVMTSHPDIALGRRLALADLPSASVITRRPAELSAIKRDGHPWDLDTISLSCRLSCTQLRVEWPQLQRPFRVEISLDHNDRYQVLFYREGRRVGQADAPIKLRDGGGLRLFRLRVPAEARAGFDALGIVPVYGDGQYSVGHLRLVPAPELPVPRPDRDRRRLGR